MTTALDLITLALKNAGVNGVGQAPSAEDAADCLLALNGMMGQWAVKRWIIYHLLDLSLESTGATSYTIGPSCDFATTGRIERLEAAFVRVNPGSGSTTVDWPLEIVQSREDWNAVTFKGINTLPAAVFLDSGYPTGTVYFWPIAVTGYELHLSVKAPLQRFANLTDAIALPDEYFEALLYNLSVRIAPMYQIAAREDVMRLATSSLQTIRGSNTQIPQLAMPVALMNWRQRQAAVAYSASTGVEITVSSNNGVFTVNTATLPTTLPTQPGVLWINGGVLCISQE